MNVPNIRGLTPLIPAAPPPSSRPAAPSTAAAPESPPPPPGATLWELLTREERAFFAERMAMGPVTYARGAATPSEAPAPLGQRIDVRG